MPSLLLHPKQSDGGLRNKSWKPLPSLQDTNFFEFNTSGSFGAFYISRKVVELWDMHPFPVFMCSLSLPFHLTSGSLHCHALSFSYCDSHILGVFGTKHSRNKFNKKSQTIVVWNIASLEICHVFRYDCFFLDPIARF